MTLEDLKEMRQRQRCSRDSFRMSAHDALVELVKIVDEQVEATSKESCVSVDMSFIDSFVSSVRLYSHQLELSSVRVGVLGYAIDAAAK